MLNIEPKSLEAILGAAVSPAIHGRAFAGVNCHSRQFTFLRLTVKINAEYRT
jgi:hypothetical protein